MEQPLVRLGNGSNRRDIYGAQLKNDSRLLIVTVGFLIAMIPAVIGIAIALLYKE